MSYEAITGWCSAVTYGSVPTTCASQFQLWRQLPVKMRPETHFGFHLEDYVAYNLGKV